MALPAFNPLPVTNAAGSFFKSSDGYVAGSMLPDPGLRYQLQSGIVIPSSTNLIYAPMGVTVKLANPANVSAALGKTVDLATTGANLNGFIVMDQAYAGIQTPQNPVPVYYPGMACNFVEFGSGARIALPIGSTLAATLQGNSDQVELTWDFTNQVVIAFSATVIPGTGNNPTTPGLAIAKIIDINIGNSKVPTPASANTAPVTWTETGSVIVLQI